MAKLLRDILNKTWGSIHTYIKDRPDRYTREFIAHNRAVWRDYRSDLSQGEILIEANNMCGCNVAMSYLGSYLGRVEKSKLVVFAKGLSYSSRLLYGSFVDSFYRYSSDHFKDSIDALYTNVFPQIHSKRHLEELRVDGILIGDLIYDLYVRRMDTTTVDVSTQNFSDMLRDSLGYLIHWQKYFSEHRVKAVLVGHCVYPWAGIITRVAVNHGVPVYLLQPSLIYYVSNSHNMRPYNDYIDYPINFSQLSPIEQLRGLNEAKERINRRFRGERDVGIQHLKKPTYLAKTGKRVLADSQRLKVLVASHCFSDDNHVYGNNLFPDFFEWMTFLGTISERTDYDWYIKLHPDRYTWETHHIEALAERYPRFNILQSDVSHHQIVEDGVSCVLTVYGTIGFEYAALGVPVITAAEWNPTSAYDFNIHPKSIEEYERLLMDLPNLRLSIDINKVYEYYFCHYINTADNWLYDNCEQVFYDVAARQKPHGTLSYRKFLDQFSMQKHNNVIHTLDRFVQSKEYRLRPKHIAPKVC